MFLLRTFGALELTTDHGEPIAGAAAQRKPLLILALAALVPGGIPRERLLRALWPGIDRTRARATLKQHLYALRRATRDANLVAGAPRLRVNAAAVHVDAIEFARLVSEDRLVDASELLAGEILEDINAPGVELGEIIAEIRATYAPSMQLVRQAIVARRHLAPPAVAPIPMRALSTERELSAAVRRFVHGMISLPTDPVAAHHRVAWTVHDLLEAIQSAVLGGVESQRIERAVATTDGIWCRSDLVRQMRAAVPGEAGNAALREWLASGEVRTIDAIGRALEQFLLHAGPALLFRQRATWEAVQLKEALGRPHGGPPRILACDRAVAHGLARWAPLLVRVGAELCLCESERQGAGEDAPQLAIMGDRLTIISGDPFVALDRLMAEQPFDLILPGAQVDALSTRVATWFVDALLGLVAQDGAVSFAFPAASAPFAWWFEHLIRWSPFVRDREEVAGIVAGLSGAGTASMALDASGRAWLLDVRREAHAQRTAGVA